MKEIEILPGDEIRLPFWTEAMFKVVDVGIYSFWGNVLDIKTGKMREQNRIEFYESDNEWIKIDSKSILENLK